MNYTLALIPDKLTNSIKTQEKNKKISAYSTSTSSACPYLVSAAKLMT